MTVSIRFYIFADDGLQRISQRVMEGLVHGSDAMPQFACQSALKFDPVSASNFDPFERRVLAVALAASELAGIAETWRARVV
jgi:hypothetical protein